MSAHRRPRRRLLASTRFRALLGLGVVLVLAVGGSFAYWSDSTTISGTSITSGTIDLKVNGQDSVTGYASLNISTMVPGNTVAGVLTITNAGTAPFTYSMDATGTNADGKNLAGALVAKVTGAGSVTGTSPSATCGGTTLSGTGTTFSANLISSATPRNLAAGGSETVCVQATLPTSASTSLQGATTGITFSVTANQLS